MDNRVNYTLVGFFVLVSIAMMLFFAYWLIRPSDKDQMKNYHIYFNESVLGLNIDAPVKYRGIEVGKVKNLAINPKNSEQVEVLISIVKSTPIKVDTLARLTPQGITGLSYINLSMGSDSSKKLQKKDGELYPVIGTEPSLYNQLEESFGSVSENLNNTLIQTSKMLNEQNQKELSLLLSNGAEFMQKMNQMLDEKTIKSFQNSMANIESTTKKIDALIPNVDRFLDSSVAWEDNISASMFSIKESYLGISSSMDEIKRAVASGEFNFKEISNGVIPNINNTLLEMQEMMIKVEDSLDRYNRSPSDIIFKGEAIKKGPGEE